MVKAQQLTPNKPPRHLQRVEMIDPTESEELTHNNWELDKIRC